MKKLTKAQLFYKKEKTQRKNIDKHRLELVDKLNQQIQKCNIEFEIKNCLCNERCFELISNFDRYGIKQSTVICTNCGLVQSMPRMTEKEYNSFYSSDLYYKIYSTQPLEDFDDSKFFFGVERFRTRFDFITKDLHLSKIKNVLEIGCASGWNLFPFFEANINVVGYDLSPFNVEYGRKKGLNLCLGSVEHIVGSYSLIILSHVVEHFSNFIETINKITKLLEPNGLIYVEVPDIKRHFGIGQLQNAHTYYFSEETLIYYMAECGLRSLKRKPSIIGNHLGVLFKLDKKYKHSLNLKTEYQFMKRIIKKYDSHLRCRELLDIFRLKDFSLSILHRVLKSNAPLVPKGQ